MTPKVSVILPTRNRAATLKRAIDSVLAQTMADLELIVVDDGSSDGTCDLVRDINDPRLRYHANEGRPSPASARNAGLRLARGEFAAFQDSDDEWLPEKLETQTKILESSPDEVCLVYGPMLWIRSDGTRHATTPAIFNAGDADTLQRSFTFIERPVGPQSILARRKVLAAAGGFDEDLKACEDTDLLMRLASDSRFQYLPRPLVRNYETPGSVSRDYAAICDALERMLRKHEGYLKSNTEALTVLERALGKYLVFTPRSSEARKWLWKAVKAGRARPKDYFWILASFGGPSAHDLLRAAESALRRARAALGSVGNAS